jgi:hypothetical protein
MADPDSVRLLDYCIERAKKALAKHGRLEPFAATIQIHGELFPLVLDAAACGGDGAADAIVTEHIAVLKEMAKREASAVALCFDGLGSTKELSPSDVVEIRVRLEEAKGDSIDVHLPYQKRKLWGYHYGAMTAVRQKHKLFFGSEP